MQADLSLRWAHISKSTFSDVATPCLKNLCSTRRNVSDVNVSGSCASKDRDQHEQL